MRLGQLRHRPAFPAEPLASVLVIGEACLGLPADGSRCTSCGIPG